MTTRHFSRREFFKGVIGAGVGLLAAPAFNEMFNVSGQVGPAATANPIKVGIIDPLTGPYKTSSIHDVHGAKEKKEKDVNPLNVNFEELYVVSVFSFILFLPRFYS